MQAEYFILFFYRDVTSIHLSEHFTPNVFILFIFLPEQTLFQTLT